MNALIDMGAFFHDKKMTSKKGRQIFIELALENLRSDFLG